MSLADELRARRGLLIAAGLGCVVVLGLLGAALVRATRDGSPPAQGRLSVAGLSDRVEIVRDRVAVPHIRAEQALDAYLGLGFSHAQDRLWQMELLRMSARGRLSELFGPSALDADRLARTLAIAVAANGEWLGVSQEVREVLGAYSNGVNRWLAEVDAGRVRAPLEFRWLDHNPEPWKPEDTLAIVRLRGWLLSRSLGASLLLDELVQRFGGVASSDFFPVRQSDGAHDTLGTMLELGKTADALARNVGLRGRVGSLGFVVGGARSATGAPLLAIDSHAELGLPPLSYVAHLDTPKLELSGATWLGIPVFWTGTSREIAWGQVATHASVTELVKENLHPEAPPRYELNGRWLAAESRHETIRVAGAPDEVVEILTTRNGPLLGTLLPGNPNARALALRWVGSGPRSGIEALLSLQHSGSWLGFRASLERYPGPVATFLYADAKQIGRQVAGKLPIRAVQTTVLPVIGGSRYYDWRGFIPFEQLPSEHGSTRPWLVASTHPEELGYRRRVIWLWSSPGAATRLRTRLGEGPPFELARVLALQREQESERGRHVVRELFDAVELKSANAVTLRTILREWDGRTDTASRGALVYHVFRHELTRELLNARLGSDWGDEILAASEPLPGVILERLLDRARPAATTAVVESALVKTWRFLQAEVGTNPGRWGWGALHQLRLRHAFEQLGHGRIRWLGRALGRGPHPVGGDPDSIWTMYHGELLRKGAYVGPGLRNAVDLADPGHAQFGLAGGQSGHSGSEHYDDGLAAWLAGSPQTLWIHESDVAYHRVGSWELRPPRE